MHLKSRHIWMFAGLYFYYS